MEENQTTPIVPNDNAPLPDAEPSTNKEEQNLAVIMSIGVLFLLFLSPLLGMLLGTDKPFLKEQSRKALNGTITYGLALVIATILNLTVILAILGLPLLFATVLVWWIAAIKGAIASSEGKAYTYPFSLSLIK